MIYQVPEQKKIMPQQGFKTLTIHEDVANKLIKIAKEYKNIDYSIGISECVELLLDLRDTALEHGIRFQSLAYHDDHVIIMDYKLKKSVKVYYKKGKVECSLHKNDECSHAGFAYSLGTVQGIIAL
ncbi:protein of unknown function [Nitrosotalea devaniterrae]|uniref:Uncharacterized protein n=1 Tax=Nitrosotalea devaniterrae TaxID=1078905 RepID=A0A128A5P0_9ARCH|nr:protein of unknown function [Candidatus Nitrosotalea devanaterra]